MTASAAVRFLALVVLFAQAGAPTFADPVEMLLEDGFEAEDFSPAGGLYYRDNFEQSAGSVEFQDEIARTGRGGLKLSVRPICAPDSDGCSERAEIWEKTELRVPYDKGVWYGFSMRFDDPPPSDNHRYVMAQWKREIGPDADGDFSPFLGLRMRQGVMFATIETNFMPVPANAPQPEAGLCPAGWVPVWLRPETRQMRLLVAMDDHWTPEITSEFTQCTDALQLSGPGVLPRPAPEWHDYAFYTRPGPDGGGRIVLAVDGAIVRVIEGRIGHDDPGLGENQYFKFGPYRDAGEGTWTLFYDNFIRSPDCNALLPQETCGALQ